MTLEALNLSKDTVTHAHPLMMLLKSADHSEAGAARDIVSARLVLRAAKAMGHPVANEIAAEDVLAAEYAAFLRKRAKANITKECDSARQALAKLGNLAQNKDVRIAVLNALFHGVRVNVSYFWEFTKQVAAPLQNPGELIEALRETLTEQIEIFRTVHETYGKIEPENLPEWDTIRSQLEAYRDDLVNSAAKAVEAVEQSEADECDCSFCTAEREERTKAVDNKPKLH